MLNIDIKYMGTNSDEMTIHNKLSPFHVRNEDKISRCFINYRSLRALTDIDAEILKAVATMKVATTSQIVEYISVYGYVRADENRIRRHIQDLAEMKFLKQYKFSAEKGCSRFKVHSLTNAGEQWCKENFEYKPASNYIKYRLLDDALDTKRLLATNQYLLYAGLYGPGIADVDTCPVVVSKHRHLGVEKTGAIVRPQAIAQTATGETVIVEAIRGSYTLPDLKDKLDRLNRVIRMSRLSLFTTTLKTDNVREMSFSKKIRVVLICDDADVAASAADLLANSSYTFAISITNDNDLHAYGETCPVYDFRYRGIWNLIRRAG